MNSIVECKAGIKLRWLNNAGFEIILTSGRHLLIDPWLDKAWIHPISIDEIERADYILLTHIHIDHAESIGDLDKKFKKTKIFVGDLSADPLCQWQGVNVNNIYRVRNGEKFVFEDITIEVISGRHTESVNGEYRDSERNRNSDDSLNLSMWFGSLEMYNYRITTSDGTSIMVWGGMTTEDQIHRMSEYRYNDIAIMHVSPKQDHPMFARLVDAIRPKVVIPHHYDLWETLFARQPDMLNDFPIPPEKVNQKYILGLISDAIENKCPHTTFFIPEHHGWYRFGISISK